MKYKTILGRIQADDRGAMARFDATSWFEKATEEQVKQIAHEGWGHGYASDRIAYELEPMPDAVDKVFLYIEYANTQARKGWRANPVGYEVEINPESAAWWLARNRPQWEITQVMIEEYGVDMLEVLADLAAGVPGVAPARTEHETEP
jgi:hypothetical protein